MAQAVDDYFEGRLEGLREVLAELQSEDHGGRTEAYEYVVNWLQEEVGE